MKRVERRKSSSNNGLRGAYDEMKQAGIGSGPLTNQLLYQLS
jgi:hypothetical protein